MENSYSASRADTFPAGLRVLVVDDDPTWLKILEKMLRKCSYEVTTCGLARVALDMLRERRNRFDIVISDVNMPDMDGFKLLEQVGLEMDLPVIMMSVDGETSRVMKGVQHGACDYLLKPVRMKELKNIWQHVFRKKIHEVKDVENHDRNGDNHMENRLEEFDEKHILTGGDISSAKKRKDVDNKEHMEQNVNDAASVKKARVIWSVDLHQKFVNAVDQIGFDKVGPKKILDLMNIPGLTRENVASHLQKYRLYLSRLQKQNEGGIFAGTEQPDPRSKYPPGTLALQSLMAMQNDNTLDSNGFFETSIHLKDRIPKVYGNDLIDIGSIQATETRSDLNNQKNESEIKVNVPGFGVRKTSEEKIQGLNYRQNEACISKHHQPGCRENQVMEFMQLMKQDQESITLMKCYSQLQQAGKHHHSGDKHLHTPAPIHLIAPSSHIKPSDTSENNDAKDMPLQRNGDPGSPQIEHGVPNTNYFEAASKTNSSSSPESYSSDNMNSTSSQEPMPELNMIAEVGLAPSNDSIVCSVQSYGLFEDVGLNGFGVLEYSNQATTTDIQSILYSELQYNCEYLFDLLEAPMTDDALFT